MFKIGTVTLKNKFILAPMAGVTDLPFRMLNRGFGCELAFVEMINVRSLSHKSKKTAHMLSSNENDHPLGVQILGNKNEFILKGLDVLRKYRFEVLDFNAACPERKVIKRGEGAALMKEPEKLRDLLKLVVQHASVPVTVKIRAGWDHGSVNAADVAKYCREAGVSAVFVHGRTRNQFYSGSVDYGVIREVKKSVDIPVIGSGDVFNAASAQRMFDETGCDAILVARGSFGNPWIFNEIKHFLAGGKIPDAPGKEEIVAVMRKHFDSCVSFYGEKPAVVIFRKFFAWYTKGFKKVRPLREKVSRIKTGNDMHALFDHVMESCQFHQHNPFV